MNEQDIEKLRKAVLEIVFDALWRMPDKQTYTIKSRNGRVSTHEALSTQETLTWGSKVDDLFKRAQSGEWKPEEM